MKVKADKSLVSLRVKQKMIVLLFKMILRHISLNIMKHIPWTQAMCEKAFENKPRSLKIVPDHFKTRELCERAV